MDKQEKSDLKFLKRLVYVTAGELCGITTVGDLIKCKGLYYFKTNFVTGVHDYRWTSGHGIKEVFREPIEIVDARSGKTVSGVGALRVYSRVYPEAFWAYPRFSYIPGTKPSGYRGYRGIKTFSTLRKTCVYWEEEGEMPFSPKSRNLPTRWDDIGRACNKERSWKSFRKTQYK